MTSILLAGMTDDLWAVLDSIDGYGWVQHPTSEAVRAAEAARLIHCPRPTVNAHKITWEGEVVMRARALDVRPAPPLADVPGCAFHGSRIEHVLSERSGECYSGTCRGDSVTCEGCGREFCRTPSEIHAKVSRLPVLALTAHDAAAVLEGGNRIVSTIEGDHLLLRAMTPGEVLAAHERACEGMGGEPSMTEAQAREIATPPLAKLGVRW
jgi:hypothetical protein